MIKVDRGLNLYIDITTACNASCDFCIAPTVGRQNNPGFFYGLSYALEFADKHNGSIQIVGGEPMISNALMETLDKISGYDYHRIVLNTNGSFMTSDKIAAAMRANVSHINISRHHYEEDVNQEIMKTKPPLSNFDLSRDIDYIHQRDINVRLNCNLIAGYIDSIEEITEYLAWAEALGVDVVSFSQVFPLSLFDYQVPPKPGYTESIQVDLNRIVSEIDRMYDSVPEKKLRAIIGDRGTSHGGGGGSSWSDKSSIDKPSGKRRYWTNGKTAFSLKVLSGYHIDTGLPKETTYIKENDPELQDDSVYFVVVHPDGMVTASWDKQERILYDPYLLPFDLVLEEIASDKILLNA